MNTYTTKEAFELLRLSGITTCSDEQVLLRWIREGKIEAAMKSRKNGYRIKDEDLKIFIEKTKMETPNKGENIVDKIERIEELEEENERLKNMMGIDPKLLEKKHESLTFKKLTELRSEMGKILAENERLKKEVVKVKNEHYKQYKCRKCGTNNVHFL